LIQAQFEEVLLIVPGARYQEATAVRTVTLGLVRIISVTAGGIGIQRRRVP
jgi:hypothetical protein